jgi:tetratricopeptide (TPR) repeat protein
MDSGILKRGSPLRTHTRWVCLLLLLTGVARAEEDVRALYERATALYALRKFGPAAEVFEKAFEKKADPAILYNAAQAHRLGGNKSRALDLYESLLRLYGSKLPNTAEISNHIRDLKTAIETERKATSSPPTAPWPAPPTATAPTSPAPAPAPAPGPAPVSVVASPPPAKDKTPITKKAWFWGVIGAGAAVVVAGVTVGIVLGTSSVEPPTPTFGSVPGN